MARVCMLSSIDNPYNPFDPNEFAQWLLYENETGLNAHSRLMRTVELPSDLSQEEEDEEIEKAIDAFIKEDFTGSYKKVIKQ